MSYLILFLMTNFLDLTRFDSQHSIIHFGVGDVCVSVGGVGICFGVNVSIRVGVTCLPKSYV